MPPAQKKDETMIGGGAPASEESRNLPAVVAQEYAVPADLADDVSADAAQDKGFGKDDLAIPFLLILQDLSPQVDKKKPEKIEGAEAGMFYNNVTGQLWPGVPGLILLPIYYEVRHSLWFPRVGPGSEKGSGLIENYGSDSSYLKNCTNVKGKWLDKDGMELVVSGDTYSYIIDEATGGYQPVLYSLSATQKKKSARWNTLQMQLQVPDPKVKGKMINPAPFYHTYTAEAEIETNAKGQAWYGVKFGYHKPIFAIPGGADIYRQAKLFKALIQSGEAKADIEGAAKAAGGAAAASGDTEEIPF